MNPESGTIGYVYDDSGNLKTRTDARSVTATYTYDALHRPLTTNYSDTTPDVTYAYHTSAGTSGTANVGRLQSITTTPAASGYVYDTLGRVQSQSQTIAGYPNPLAFSRIYYLNDAPKSQTYPSGRTVSYGVDDAGRVTTVAAGTRTYADMTGVTGRAYAPDGRLRQMKLGNNLWETRDYQTPGTATRFKLGTSAGTLLSPGTSERLELGYNYHATANNGNLTGHTITRSTTTWTQTFGYDAVNRLETAGETAGYSRTFSYDRYGNRWVASNSGMTAAESHEPVANVFNAANNRMTVPTVGYDAAGNQTRYSPYTLVYDAENRLISMTSASSGSGTYLYDGESRRVKKTWTPTGGAAQDTYYVYDIAGNLAAEYGAGSTSTPGTQAPAYPLYPFTDMLGSVRAVTDAVGAVLECYDYLPFGRILGSSDNGRAALGCHPSSPDASLASKTSQKFTGQVRDEETRLDYFKARYMSAPEGRFLSPDPLLNSGRPWLPQSWNKYSYALNNPLKLIDPTGLYICDGTDDECAAIEAAIERVTEARDKFDKGSDEYVLLDSVLTAYGTADVDNGVTVAFVNMEYEVGAITAVDGFKPVTVTNPSGQATKVTMNSKYIGYEGGNMFTVAHEGVHVAHGTAALNAVASGSERFSLTGYERETMAFKVQSLIGQAFNRSTVAMAGVEIWNSSWKEADIKELRSNGIREILNDPSGLYKLSIENPGSSLFP